MEEIAGVIGDWLHPLKSKEQLGQLTFNIFYLLDSFRRHKLTHADLHLLVEFGYVYTYASKKHLKLMPIDFERSSKGKLTRSWRLAASCASLAKHFT